MLVGKDNPIPSQHFTAAVDIYGRSRGEIVIRRVENHRCRSEEEEVSHVSYCIRYISFGVKFTCITDLFAYIFDMFKCFLRFFINTKMYIHTVYLSYCNDQKIGTALCMRACKSVRSPAGNNHDV